MTEQQRERLKHLVVRPTPAVETHDDIDDDTLSRSTVREHTRPNHQRPQHTALQQQAISTYTALHGHPLEQHDQDKPDRPTKRWSFTARTTLALFIAATLTVAVIYIMQRTGNSTTEQAIQVAALPTTPQKHTPEAQTPHSHNDKPVESTPQDTAPPHTLVVHVAGQVKTPGVYELPAQSRVIDAIKIAGNHTKQANPNALNLARLITDGEHIYVPHKDDPHTPATPSQPNGPAHTDTAPPQVNINTATLEQLEKLPGIGPALAQRIIDWRTTHGQYTHVEELDNISGIGPALLHKIRDHVIVH